MELDTLKDLYIQELKDLFSAEQQLVKALPVTRNLLWSPTASGTD